ncbi:MAG: YHYH protein [Bacteroidetes bacterium]|nr:YHYH protein [Bacteroidota bacterium]
MEDYEYVPGLGDLDEHNGRFCITKDYPNGTYAYFTTIDWVADHGRNSIKPVFPYVLGTAYYGEVNPTDGNTGPNSGFVVISEPVTPYYGSTTSVSEVVSPLSVSVYPNPTSGGLNIDTRGMEESETLQCMIYDSKGALVNKWTLQSKAVNTMDGQHLLNGVYLVRIQTASQSKNFKLMVSK